MPPVCTAVVVAESGQTRRAASFGAARVHLGPGEVAWCFHPGPYALALLPFAAAAEAGLRVEFVVDAGDPRVAQQRFDLYLASELARDLGALTVASFAAAAQSALQNALAEGMLDLPPCTSIEEWHAFRAGLNELLYTRFGVTVEDCYPIDLHPVADLAATLRARGAAPASLSLLPPSPADSAAAPTAPLDAARPAAASAEPPRAASAAPSAPATTASPALTAGTADAGGLAPIYADAPPASPASPLAARAVEDAAREDARALRRLFLELPALSAALRMVTPPSSAFARQQDLLQRLALAALDVNTMPALELAAPGCKLPKRLQEHRSFHATQAAMALDNAWALLARLKLASPEDIVQLFDEADRLIANLEFALAERRAVPAAGAVTGEAERREPTLGSPGI
ncbi:hypothetical protein ACHMW6_14285 [Pseudoduganella sp. UC29_106]|uniref:hypothetical protein n=1 Tax=Pseudoduganella sp. UC29_106 TaxID=3374553 RepID=UPI0037574640